ncbi:hypothetical protein OV090_18070 [Nannocystis sp. RBIL2]|uniref:hypothetical protein n=1 Tax=Nannocystis sp. RBIL2 TaxID=2996788 RepID=UPI00226F58CF|nr:hypothetical protein [Nannocystis sp. RBIL2]MCY1066688.1 hypothetical protein [Nannocystis sp. RBIL2]
MTDPARTFREEDLDFTFDATWTIARQWDTESVFLTLRDWVPGSHGVDFVGVRAGKPNLFFIEVKDYRTSEDRGSTRDKVENSGERLAELVGAKVRDTVAGLIGAARAARDPDWKQARLALSVEKGNVWVVLWIEHAGLAGPVKVRRQRESIGTGVLQESIRRRTRWLHARALVCSRDGECLPGLTVKSIAQAERVPGRRR